MRVQAHSSLEQPPEYNQNQMPLMTLLTILAVTEILCSFRLVLKRKTGKKLANSASNFALSGVEDNTFGPFNIGGIVDLP